MNDPTKTAAKRGRDASPVVDAVCRQLERQVDATDSEHAVRFAELFLSKAPPEFLQGRSADQLAHLTRGTFEFLKQGHPDRVDVQVFNPDVDNEGWYAPVTVVRTNISERPFIVDSLREFLSAQDMAIEHLVYPLVHVERDDQGTIVDIRSSREGVRRESVIHCEVARCADEEMLDFLREETARRLQDVVRATDDFGAMLEAARRTHATLGARIEDLPERKDELTEIQAFLQWLQDEAFVFLGYRGYDLVHDEAGHTSILVEPGSGLGILRNEAESAFAEPVRLDEIPEGIRGLVEGGPILIISKTNAESTVHRRARMDYIGVKKLAPDGTITGEHRFVGLFTSRVYAADAEHVPILRRKLDQILSGAGVLEGSHDYKEINTIFNSMPKEELFLTSAEEIGADIQTVMTTYRTEEVRVTLRDDPLSRGVAVMVILPKDRFSGEIRKAIEVSLVDALEGELLNYHLALGEGDQARLHFHIGTTPEKLGRVDASELERVVRELIRSWADRVREGLERVRPPDEARRLARIYGDAFSAEYRAATPPKVAVRDILELQAMQADGRMIAISLENRDAEAAAGVEEPFTELKVYLRGVRLVLSDFMPILENAGLRVIAVNPFDVKGEGAPDATVYSFSVQSSQGLPVDVRGRGTLLADTILAVRAGDATNDRVNSLVISAGLAWREADVLRSYCSYAFQIGAVPTRASLWTALNNHPEIARILFDLFEARFDPEGLGTLEERAEAAEDIRSAFQQALSGVELLAEDRALRRLAVLIDGTVRTNYYRNGGVTPTRRSGGVPYLSFKFASDKLVSVVRTRLKYEVWVRSSRMEGVHLRGAMVARGGIRHSDRRDDFRIEVLGLVNTQIVKNAVIVPGGSKGGFVTLRTMTGLDAAREDSREQYKTLMRGLLDLTDNIRDVRTVPPENVVCWDEPDPYLVVAADKGTATFSDVANGVAEEYGFWLGDAFASGGSHGYDHKKVGITARGAWEGVKRHFREKGKDIQTEPFTVVGIGDMSGDVFGNGMLLSEQIRLLAAFDHRHVFIDPDPDPASSFAERRRLFDMGRSSWDDYDRSALSAGGMIIDRGAKQVELSAEARAALGIEADTEEMDGESLVRSVLRAPAELLWNGGIGTYVKASTEIQADVGDPSNDAVRIDVPELRVEVVGEGGNLGLTQAARIEYALRGGRINTDALDNSGGVDLSDREVNLKILLSPGTEASMSQRNALLEDLTDAVAALVLKDNESQSMAISLDEVRARESADDFRGLMSSLERAGELDRKAEHLPTLEALVERMEGGKTLCRPELCVLLAYAKLNLKAHILKSPLPDDPAATSYLLGYFPAAAVRAAGSHNLNSHRLRREIIASQLTNDLVDTMGAAFVQRIVSDTGRRPEEVARAWLVAARLSGHRTIVERLRSQRSNLTSNIAYRWLLGLARVLERTTRWVLANVDASESTAGIVDDSLEGLAALRRRFGEIVAGEDRGDFFERVQEIQELGADEESAKSLVTLRYLDHLLDVLRVAKDTQGDPLDSARAYYRVSELLQLPWLRRSIFDVAEDDRWEQRAAQALMEDLNRAHHRMAARVMVVRRSSEDVDAAVEELQRSISREWARYAELVEEVRSEEYLSLAGLSAVVREATVLAGRNGRRQA
jgi:glutamate dehydrogenase